MERWQKLAKMQLEAERKHFPDGLTRTSKLLTLARHEVSDYFQATYGVGERR